MHFLSEPQLQCNLNTTKLNSTKVGSTRKWLSTPPLHYNHPNPPPQELLFQPGTIWHLEMILRFKFWTQLDCFTTKWMTWYYNILNMLLQHTEHVITTYWTKDLIFFDVFCFYIQDYRGLSSYGTSSYSIVVILSQHM